MIIIEKPYASEFLIDTIVQNDWGVLDNTAVEEADIEEGAFDLISSDIAKNYYLTQEYPLIYSNSENAITWVLKNLPDSNLSNYIKIKSLSGKCFRKCSRIFISRLWSSMNLKK